MDHEALIAMLGHAPALIVPMVRETPPDRLRRQPAPATWSIHEHMCHLAQVHDVFFGRLDLMLAQDNPLIQPYQPDTDEAPGFLLDQDLDGAMARFAADRERFIARLAALSPAEWARPARHPEYSRYSIEIMARHLALHDLAHAYEIEALLLRPDWD